MSYIVVINPAILATEETGLPFTGVVTATVAISLLMTLLMGLYAKLPFAVAPGMGLNAFFAYTIIAGLGVPWQTALGMVFWSGVLFLLISIIPLREWITRAIPVQLRLAAAAGIGLLLTFIGLQRAGIVVSDPVTLVRVGPLGLETGLAVFGIVIIAILVHQGNPLAFLAGIFAVTLLAWLAGRIDVSGPLVSAPDFTSTLFHLDLLGSLKLALLPATLSLLFTDLFDSISTFVGVSQATGLTDSKGQPRNLRKGLLVDAIATLSSGIFGTSPGTTYIESSAGIHAGGRTGLTSVVTALCFVPCLFMAPLVAVVPAYATSPVLIVVGLYMFRTIADLSLTRIEDSLPAYLTILLIPLTFSITQGILWGLVSFVVLYLVVGRGREVSAALYCLGILAALLLAVEAQVLPPL